MLTNLTSQLLFSFGDIFKYGFYILLAFAILMVMVTIHEFGHYVAGRKLGFKINEFSVGFGKVLFQKKNKAGILVSLRLFPLGGYCAFDGEDGDIEGSGSFNSQKPWKRLIVQFSGAFFNFLSAILFSIILLMAVGYGDRLQVTNVDSTFNPAINQIQNGDVIIAVNDQKTSVVYNNYYTQLVSPYGLNEEFTVTVNRNGEVLEPITIKKIYGYAQKTEDLIAENIVYTVGENEFTITTRSLEDNKIEYTLTVVDTGEKYTNETGSFSIGGVAYKYLIDSKDMACLKTGLSLTNYKYTFLEAVGRSVPFTCEWAYQCLVLFGQLITGELGLEGVGGPITTISSIVQLTMSNMAFVLVLFPLISINLAVFNLLPIPALDGARMVFTTIEWIRKKPINRKVEGYIHGVGLIVLFAFVIFVDILNIFI